MADKSLTVIAFHSAAELPLWVAVERGVFERAGLRVQVEQARGSGEQMEALASGKCQLVHTAADNIVSRTKGGPEDPCILMGLNRGLLRLVAHRDVGDYEELRGAQLGVDDERSGYALVLRRMLEARGLSRDTYKLMEIGGTAQRAEALAGGQIAATLLTPPYDEQLCERGFRRLGRAVDAVPEYLGAVVAAKKSWARERGDVVEAYVNALREAFEAVLDDDHDAALKDVLRQRLGGDAKPEASLDGLRDPKDGLIPEGAITVDDVEPLLDLRRQAGFDAPASAADCFCGDHSVDANASRGGPA